MLFWLACGTLLCFLDTDLVVWYVSGSCFWNGGCVLLFWFALTFY